MQQRPQSVTPENRARRLQRWDLDMATGADVEAAINGNKDACADAAIQPNPRAEGIEGHARKHHVKSTLPA